ncbi:MAG: hypothetical protein JNJ61_03460 [Anaerolineae bacterium]|nr:hypothetical protein [Anaerolineae bacterium]
MQTLAVMNIHTAHTTGLGRNKRHHKHPVNSERCAKDNEVLGRCQEVGRKLIFAAVADEDVRHNVHSLQSGHMGYYRARSNPAQTSWAYFALGQREDIRAAEPHPLIPSPIATLSSVSVDMSQRVRVAGEGQCGSSGVSFCRLRRTFGIRGGGHGSVTEGNPLGPRPCKDGELAGGAKKLPSPGDATTSGVSNSCVVSIPDGRGVGGEVLEMLPQPDRPKRSSCCVFPRKDSRASAYILPRLDFV